MKSKAEGRTLAVLRLVGISLVVVLHLIFVAVPALVDAAEQHPALVVFGGVLVVVFTALPVLWAVQRKRIATLLREIESVQAEAKRWQQNAEERQRNLDKAKNQTDHRLSQCRHDLRIALEDVRRASANDWLHELPGLAYGNEVEVEAKFVYPLLRHLGYEPNALRMRVPLSVQIGRHYIRGEADWVAYNDGAPWLVVEAKAENQELTEEVHGQAKSYAAVLGAPIYAYTNGRQLRVYERGVQRDKQLLATRIDGLSMQWRRVTEALGPPEHSARSAGETGT